MARQLGAALEFLQARFKGLLRSVETTPTVAATAGLILGFDAERISATFVNLSANIIHISPSSEASATRGILIPAGGGAIAINVEEDGMLPTSEWYAIAALAGSAMYVLEVKREVILEADEGGA